MTSRSGGIARLRRFVPAFVALAAVALSATPMAAGVRSTTEVRSYRVYGNSPAALVSFMRSQPLQGDRGAAVANIHPYYSLSMASKPSAGGVCRATSVNVNIRFVMTLPQASSKGSFTPGTNAAWNNFASFAKTHEETHRRIYVDCANGFVAKALKLTSSTSCPALEANIRRLFEAEKRGCDSRQLAFDMRDYKRVFGLSLFKLAKSPVTKPKPARISAATGGGSSAIAAPPP